MAALSVSRRASRSSFALLPPDIATGNFTKVVQRIPSVSSSGQECRSLDAGHKTPLQADRASARRNRWRPHSPPRSQTSETEASPRTSAQCVPACAGRGCTKQGAWASRCRSFSRGRIASLTSPTATSHLPLTSTISSPLRTACVVGMGKLVQSPAAPGAHRQHPAGRSRGTLLRRAGATSDGGLTQTKWPPANPGRFRLWNVGTGISPA